MRVQAGVSLPEFAVQDLEGETASPQSYFGRRLWLILARFAACPFCALRLHRLIESYSELRTAGVDVLVVFPSTRRRVRQFANKYAPLFRLVADPEQRLFELFGSETSWSGELRSVAKLGVMTSAIAKFGLNPLAVDDSLARMPSEFLVAPSGVIDEVHYGRFADDGFSIDHVISWGMSRSSAPPRG
jgi:peroxiredoxin